MKLYFEAGKNKRVAIDTVKETYNTDYFYLGPWHTYITISVKDYTRILRELDFNMYDYEEQF